MDPIVSQSIGKLGEDIASKFLLGKGYVVLHRNYRKPYGEIDIIARKSNIVHFIEVKTVSRITSQDSSDTFRPEDNVHKNKLLRLSRVIEVYIEEFSIQNDWQFDVLTVVINPKQKTARIQLLPDIVIGS